MDEKNYDLEDAIERVRLTIKATELFEHQKVLQQWSDGLIYVFDNVVDALSFTIYRVKEIDFCGTFGKCTIGNISSKDKYISIESKEDNGWCNIKLLSSFEYPSSSTKESNDINQDEIDYMLDDKGLYEEDDNIKLVLLAKEIERCLSKNDKGSINYILDRYYGKTGWDDYWVNYAVNKKKNQAYFNIKLNSLAINKPIVRIPIKAKKKIDDCFFKLDKSLPFRHWID